MELLCLVVTQDGEPGVLCRLHVGISICNRLWLICGRPWWLICGRLWWLIRGRLW